MSPTHPARRALAPDPLVRVEELGAGDYQLEVVKAELEACKAWLNELEAAIEEISRLRAELGKPAWKKLLGK
ncbi:MAG: hypothetical protein AB9903_03105 [Vulcanimicrobiota bacterium]